MDFYATIYERMVNTSCSSCPAYRLPPSPIAPEGSFDLWRVRRTNLGERN